MIGETLSNNDHDASTIYFDTDCIAIILVTQNRKGKSNPTCDLDNSKNIYWKLEPQSFVDYIIKWYVYLLKGYLFQYYYWYWTR